MSSLRHRDLFPPPSLKLHDFDSLAEDSRRSPGHCKLQHRALKATNQSILALNQLGGRGFSKGRFSRPSGAASTAAQRIGAQIWNFSGLPQESPAPQEALSELLTHSGLYSQDRVDAAPYSKELVSWPKVGAVPMRVGDGLPPADREWF